MFELVNSTLLLITTILVSIYLYLKLCVYNYWKKHGVPHETPTIPFGNLKTAFFTGQEALGNVFWNSYKKFGKHPFHGVYLFSRPVLMINDPELIKLVLVKEFPRFENRGWYSNPKADPTSFNLFAQPSEIWRKLRGKISPAFTPLKLKQVFPLMTEVCEGLINTCNEELRVSDGLHLINMIGRYNTEIISNVVYGFEPSSLQNPNNDFRRLGMEAITFGRFKLFVAAFFPDLLKGFNIPFFSKEVRQFFTKIFTETVNNRRKAKVVRKDFINIFMQLIDMDTLKCEDKSKEDNKVNNDNKITMDEATAQALVFFLAGFETSTSLVSYCLLELALNPDIQEKLHNEIKGIAETSGFTFENILETEYLDMVFSETQRKYPGVVFLNRICDDDLLIPKSNYVIPKGMRIVISTLGVHYDPKHFPDPETFDPDRFSKKNSANRTPYVNLGFGEGPRNCIGQRFGMLQSKLAIAMLIQNYKFFISSKTILPVKFTSESLVVSPHHEIYLRVELRNK